MISPERLDNARLAFLRYHWLMDYDLEPLLRDVLATDDAFRARSEHKDEPPLPEGVTLWSDGGELADSYLCKRDETGSVFLHPTWTDERLEAVMAHRRWRQSRPAVEVTDAFNVLRNQFGIEQSHCISNAIEAALRSKR